MVFIRLTKHLSCSEPVLAVDRVEHVLQVAVTASIPLANGYVALCAPKGSPVASTKGAEGI